MKATVEPLEGNKVKVSVEVGEAELDKAIDAAFRKIAREVRVRGFRPGKAPRKLLERQLGSEVGRQQALHDSLPEFYAQALREQDVDAIAPPDIDITAGEEEGPLAFDAVVEIRPEVQVAGYDGLRVTIDRPEVSDEAVDEHIDRMRSVQATLDEVDRPAQDDDVVTIDITGTLDGEAQDGLTAEDYSYSVGSGSITPEVDEQLRGAKAGDILEFEATHPSEDEEGELRFRVLVKQVNAQVLPEADDEWASESSEFSTIEELRDSIRDRLQRVAKARAAAELPEKLGEALAQLVDEEPPEPLVEQEAQHRAQDMLLRMGAQGLDLQQLAASGGLPEELVDRMKDGAKTAVLADLGLRSVATAEGLECSDDELNTEIEEMATRMGQKPRRVFNQLERGGQLTAVRSEVRKRKALDWLLERVEIVDPDGKPIERSELNVDDDSVEDSSDDETENEPE